MKYFYKLLLSMMLVLTSAVSIMEYYSVVFSLEHSFQRERDSQLTEHQLVKHAVQSAILNVKSDRTILRGELAIIGKNAAGLLKERGGLLLSGVQGKPYYTDLSSTPDLTDIKNGKTSYQVIKGKGGEAFLLVKSKFTQDNQELVLVTEQDASPVFSEAEALQEQCTRLYFVVLGTCVPAALVMAFALTRPLTVLRRTSRAFAEGNYSARAHVRVRDEVGELAEAYNNMAKTIEEKIYQLKEAAQRQERFTASFSHELKTPMTSIIGYADTIYQKELSPEQTRQAAWYIMNEGMRLESLSFKLMELITLNKAEFTLEETEITNVLRDVEATAIPLAKKRGVELLCDMDPGWVRLEYDLFKTLLLNLIDNALKSGGSYVLLQGDTDGDFYRVAVSDNGRGIPPEELAHIMEAFYMVDKSRSRKEHGAGLGLSLCARIAEIHGTKLEYDSELGKGTTVSFTLRREVGGDET